LISDIAMPKVDGYDLIRQVRRRESGTEKRLPAVALTAYARVQDRMRAIMAGYNTHVAKPVEANELVTVVASLAGRLGKI
jgi:CheY-like chemotaxis protein